ncbi:hypothetical protein ACHAXH_004064 [Discostella pseudostelligera]
MSTATGASTTAQAAAAATAPPLSEQEILSTYRKMQSEMQNLIQTLTKVEMERNEHRRVRRMSYLCYPLFLNLSAHSYALSLSLGSISRLVEETLEPLDPDRRAFRLVGGVLLDVFVQNLKDKLDTTQKEAAAWKAKYNLRTQEEIEAANRRQ